MRTVRLAGNRSQGNEPQDYMARSRRAVITCNDNVGNAKPTDGDAFSTSGTG